MSRTIGATGKALFLRVPLSELNKKFNQEMMIDVSIEAFGAFFNVDRNACPRTKTVVWGEAPVAPVSSAIHIPAQPVVYGLSIPNEKNTEKEPAVPVGQVIDLSGEDY